MFTIYGGKAAFDQWDKGQRVENPEMAAGDKVIFLNGCGETHPMKAYTHEGSVVCDVPNDLLRMARPILVDLCGSREHTTRLLVTPREKPDDYVYEDNTMYPQESTGGASGAGCDCESGGGSGASAPLIVTVSDENGRVPSHTYTEIYEAAMAGRVVFCNFSDSLCALATATSWGATFIEYFGNDFYRTIRIDDGETATVGAWRMVAYT